MSVKKLKAKLDKVFSLFIRLRDSDHNGFAKCVTCGRVNHFKKMDCGHYIKRQYLSTRYDEKNCACQCKFCNNFEQGANEKFKIAIDKRWGEGTSDTLEIKKHNKTKLTSFEYEALIKEYQQKIKMMPTEKYQREYSALVKGV